MSSTKPSTSTLSGAAAPFVPRAADIFRDCVSHVRRFRERRAHPPFRLGSAPNLDVARESWDRIYQIRENNTFAFGGLVGRGFEESAYGRQRAAEPIVHTALNVPLRVRNLQPRSLESNWPSPDPLPEFMQASKLEVNVYLGRFFSDKSPASQKELFVYESEIREGLQDKSPPTPRESAIYQNFLNLNSTMQIPRPPRNTRQQFRGQGITMRFKQPARIPATPTTPTTPTGLIPPKGPKLWQEKIYGYEPTARKIIESGTFEERFQRLKPSERLDFLDLNYVNINVQLPADYSTKICAHEIEDNTSDEGSASAGENTSSSISDDDIKSKGKGKAMVLSSKEIVEYETKSNDKGKGREVVLTTKEVTKIEDTTAPKNDFDLTTDAIKQIVDMVQNTTIRHHESSFTNVARRIMISLHFPVDPSITPINSSISIAPLEGPATNSPYFAALENLVEHINQTFQNIKELIILLRVPCNSRMPFTLPQLYHILPFYDLEFTKWFIMYRPSNLSVEIKVEGWSVQKLDRERGKYMEKRIFETEEQERRVQEATDRQLAVENAVAVRPSAGLGDVDLRNGEVSGSGSVKQGLGELNKGDNGEGSSFTSSGSSGHASPTPSSSTNGSLKPLLH